MIDALLDDAQMIDALQDMDIAGSSSMVTAAHGSLMECDVEDDDLLGEELSEMENHKDDLDIQNLEKAHKHKRNSSSRSGARARIRFGNRLLGPYGVSK